MNFKTPFYLRAKTAAGTVINTFSASSQAGTLVGFCQPEPIYLERELIDFQLDHYFVGYRNSLTVAFEYAGSTIPAFSTAYSASSTYALGDRVIYSTALYVCTTAITSPEAWTAGHWALVNTAGAVSSLEATLNGAGTGGYLLEYSLDGQNWVPCILGGSVTKEKVDGKNQAVHVELSLTNKALTTSPF